ncbi:MAG: hypothetical protein ACR2OD_11835 [Gaiellaceae bacterium]
MLVYPDMELNRRIIRDRLWRAARVARRIDLARRACQPARSQGAAAIEVRAATAADMKALERVAALDEQPPLAGRNLLVAEVGGTLWAGLDPDSRASVADPFVPSADAVELLRVRATQIAGTRGVAPWRSSRSRRDGASATVGA